MLDPKGLEAAWEAWDEAQTDPGHVPLSTAITAYLSTITPAEVGGLVERLRDMGGGEHAVATCQEAAAAIEALSAALASERGAHAETRRERDEAFQKYVDANEARIEAEALSALSDGEAVEPVAWQDATGKELHKIILNYQKQDILSDLTSAGYHLLSDADLRASPEMIAAAWATWKVRHQDKLGPGPAFVEAINAALAIRAMQGGKP